jgi:hypothetical protein
MTTINAKSEQIAGKTGTAAPLPLWKSRIGDFHRKQHCRQQGVG